MRRYAEGNLSVGAARIGLKVRCIIVPDMSLWLSKYKHLCLKLPKPAQVYTIRSNVFTESHAGILLCEIRNQQVNLSHLISGEPFFAHSCFSVAG